VEPWPGILIVEDDPLIRSLVEDALCDGGFEAAISSSGEEAVKLLTENGKYCALVTDVSLGRNKMTGWDVARHARELHPDFPVVYMTGDSAAEWTVHGVPHSILLTKPFAPAQIVTAVSQVLNNSQPAV
jgi:DNA-binding response OmpR family regulator